jgi:hypothetical protein
MGLLSLLLLALLLATTGVPPARAYLLAVGAGFLVGSVGCLLFNRVYDFTHMRLQHSLPEWVERWPHFILVALAATASLLRTVLTERQAVATGSFLLTALIVFFAYLAVQAWRHRPHH